MEQTISPIGSDMLNWIASQSDWVKGHFGVESLHRFDSVDGKAHLLQGMIHNNLYDKTKTVELQAMGVVLGLILAEDLGLNWVEVEDDYGKDPALRYKETTILFFPRTMISKRIERDEVVRIDELRRISRQTLDRMLTEGYQ